MKREQLEALKMPFANYGIDVSWNYLDTTLDHYREAYGLDMNPDFQRAHVWTETQQIAYVEWIIRGGQSGKEIYFNCSGWQKIGEESVLMVLVDGKQRIHAVQRFLNNEIPAFGYLLKDMECGELLLRSITDLSFSVHINNLKTREEVLQWYLFMNSGGTDHTSAELDKVRNMLKEEK